jgi:hypothetical protein
MGFNKVDPTKKAGRQGVEPPGEADFAGVDAYLLNEELIGLKHFIQVCFVIAFPLLTILTVYNLLRSRLIEAILICCMEILILWSYFLMRKSRDTFRAPTNQIRIYRNIIRGFLLLFLIIIVDVVGWKSELDQIQYSYIFPIVAFLSLGKREGLYWVVIFLASMVLILFYPQPNAFFADAFWRFKLRYLISFSTMCVVGFVWKLKIDATYARLVDRQGQLVESEKKCREA